MRKMITKAVPATTVDAEVITCDRCLYINKTNETNYRTCSVCEQDLCGECYRMIYVSWCARCDDIRKKYSAEFDDIGITWDRRIKEAGLERDEVRALLDGKVLAECLAAREGKDV